MAIGRFVAPVAAPDSPAAEAAALPPAPPPPVTTFPRVSVSDARALEGEVLVFTVTMDRPAAFDVTVYYNTVSRTALGGQDFQPYTGLRTDYVVISSGQTSAAFTVQSIEDRLIERHETFEVTIGTSKGAGIADGRGVGTILNDDFGGLSRGFFPQATDWAL